jgi:hypothetical protein
MAREDSTILNVVVNIIICQLLLFTPVSTTGMVALWHCSIWVTGCLLHAVLSPRPGQPQVLHPDDTGRFTCAPQSRGGGIHNTIQWWINGSRVPNFNPEYVKISIDSFLETGILQIQNVYNGSTIHQ